MGQGPYASVDKAKLGKPMEPLPPYPKVMTEDETLDAILGGRSCARYGDGEMRLVLDGNAVSQVNDKNLSAELQGILRGPTHSVVCLPHYNYGPRVESWKKYGVSKFVRFMKQPIYGSAFISRPDSQPGIDRPDYWHKVRALWKDRDITLVVGTDYGSINEKFVRDAKSFRMVFGPRRDAYGEISRLEQEIGTPPKDHAILLCLGACATVLAERLARKGCWAMDLGHIGKFMPKEFR